MTGEQLRQDLHQRITAMRQIVTRIENDEIKHSSKLKKQLDLAFQRGFLNACEVILSDLDYEK